MGKNIFFNAHLSPMEAFSSFTLGYHGNGGGLTGETRRTAPNEAETATV
ncbi:hypothetical protein [Fictibacillus sp. S7]|nr:hypothetical protein [Fictibacillus sp. S7]